MIDINLILRVFYFSIFIFLCGCASQDMYSSYWDAYDESMMGRSGEIVCDEIRAEENARIIPECEQHFDAYEKAYTFCSMCDSYGQPQFRCRIMSRLLWNVMSRKKEEDGMSVSSDDMILMCEAAYRVCVPISNSVDADKFRDFDSFPGFACKNSSSNGS